MQIIDFKSLLFFYALTTISPDGKFYISWRIDTALLITKLNFDALFSDFNYEIFDLHGKPILVYKNYMYSVLGSALRNCHCSKKSAYKCKAKLKLNKDGHIIRVNGVHNHPPNIIKCSTDGNYYKM